MNRKFFTGGSLLVLVFALVLPALAVAAQEPEAAAFAIRSDDPDLQWGPCPPFMPEGCSIAVLHGDPAAQNTDVLFRVPANSSIPSHWHTSAERMILVSGEMTVQYDAHDPVSLREGSYAYGPPELPHTAECLDAGPCVLFIAFEEPVDAFATE